MDYPTTEQALQAQSILNKAHAEEREELVQKVRALEREVEENRSTTARLRTINRSITKMLTELLTLNEV